MLTFLGDVLKGTVPVLLSVTIVDSNQGPGNAYFSLVALAAFFGHLYPLFTKFKDGGKGVATTAGCFVVLAPLACLIALGAFILLLFTSRYVSIGSLAAAIVLPLAVWFSTHCLSLTVGAGVMTLFIFVRHSNNIRRLFSGEEPEFREKK